MGDRISIGLIGASANRGWARTTHVPAIAATPSFVLHAVATSSQASANEAAAAFGAPLAFGDPIEMVDCDEIDAVSVAVRAPAHYALVKRALDRGKPVYCEWPLGASLRETEELACLAERRGLITMIGLQGRSSPWVERLRRYVARDGIGRLLSTTFVADDDFSSGSIDQGNAYMLDVTNGANALTIHGGHFLDTLCHVLGECVSISADVAVSHPVVVIRETDEAIRSTSPDNIAISAMLAGGAVASMHIRPGNVGKPSLWWEIQGEKGTLRVTSDGYVHWRPLAMEVWDRSTGMWRTLGPQTAGNMPTAVAAQSGPAENVTRHYQAFARAILTGHPSHATFSDALLRHRMIEGVARSASSGRRQFLAQSTTAAARKQGSGE